MNHTSYDIILIGGGMMGLSLAARLSPYEFRIAVVELELPLLAWNSTDYDARVSALTLSSAYFLQQCGVWEKILPGSLSPLHHMTVWDELGGGKIEFDRDDMAQDQLGFIVENRAIVKALYEEVQHRVTFYCPAKPQSLVITEEYADLQLEEGTVLRAPLLIGADGAHSWLRAHQPFECSEKSYDQSAIVAVIECEKPHNGTAFQNFLPTGPLGVLPLANPHQVAIVWSTSAPNLSEDAFDEHLTQAVGHRLGRMRCLQAPRLISLVERHVTRYSQPHVVLMGDAAHTLHPLAGQGANLGFADSEQLSQLLIEAKQVGKTFWSEKIMRRYERARKSENALMLGIMRVFKELFAEENPALVKLRSFGFNVCDRQRWIKQFFMRQMEKHSV
ncbi:MAG TPA: UbiH/UbiF/VisC/COQ6 family ubiquinone biosynthesis hydroxylase [Coxiellaceae bacterium]|nr:UbiH/UbiF/VisC/COQ6 family ubiquinone biosynthesis hydroxylase [Coxiellaceae bacterium]